jgi:hypothetical protein
VIKLVNIIPNDHSGEANQDSEPNLAVNPANPLQIAATAFTPGSPGGNAPIYVSTDAGSTWQLNPIVPAPGGNAMTFDITLRFDGTNNDLYASSIRDDSPVPSDTIVNVLRTTNFTSPATMTALETRNHPDQPFIQATTVISGPDAGKDRVYVGNNNFNGTPRTASLDLSLDAAVALPTFTTTVLEARGTGTAGQDGPQVRPAIHADGTIYAAFYGWRAFSASGLVTSDIVIVRDDNWGAGANPFTALVDGGDGLNGVRVVTGIQFTWDENLGQERTGGDLSIAVDPNDSSIVYLAWADHPAVGYTVHVCRSTDRGVTWSGDLRMIVNATNPALTINSDSDVGFLYQQLTGSPGSQRWETHLQRSADGISWQDLLLATVPASTPVATFDPYLGDYEYLMAVGTDFYGIFCANNTPDLANFPQGVTYQRNCNFGTATLLAVDNVTPVAVSIDPFFFRFSKDTPLITWSNPADIVYGTPLTGGPAGQLNATVSPPVPGTFSYNHSVGDCLTAGTYTLSVTFTPNDTLNFSIATASVPLTVRKATPTINWANPPDIDFGTLLDNTQLNATASWVVCGTPVTVPGTFSYAPPAGPPPLPVGTHTLSVFFMPADTANYNPATATVQIHVLTGYPIVISVTFAPTTLQREERVQVTVIVKNDSVNPHVTQGPDPGFEYSEGDTFQTKGFPSVDGAYRIAVDLDLTPYPYKVHYLYRWGFGHTLAPGESVAVNGYIRFHNSRENAPYYVGMIQEVNNVVQDHQGTTGITVERP